MAYSVQVIDVTEDGRHNVALHRVSCPYGHITWEVEGGEVYSIFVHRDFRRQGHATRMWALASNIAPIQHAACRTDDGDAFARSVGGYLPERERA